MLIKAPLRMKGKVWLKQSMLAGLKKEAILG